MRRCSILIVNRNNLKITKDVLSCLDSQSYKDFDVHVVDNGSKPSSGKGGHSPSDLIAPCLSREHRLTLNAGNRALNHIWNDFALTARGEILLYLNNDVLFTRDYLKETMQVFDERPAVHIVNHATNHPKYKKVRPFSYKIQHKKYMQGWDFAIRKDRFPQIPECLKVFCGDSYIYETVYERGGLGAIVTSTPLLHFVSKTTSVDRHTLSARDVATYRKLGMPWADRPQVSAQYSKIHMTFKSIEE